MAGGHIRYYDREEMRNKITPYVFHLNGIGATDKQSYFEGLGKWTLNSNNDCLLAPPLQRNLTDVFGGSENNNA
jgi:hypothetical protein